MFDGAVLQVPVASTVRFVQVQVIFQVARGSSDLLGLILTGCTYSNRALILVY